MKLVRKLITVALALGLVGCGYFSVRHLVVPTEAMLPTIEVGDHLALLGVQDNEVDPIQRFDIVGYHRQPDQKRGIDKNTIFVHRVIGLPGEIVEIRQGVVLINGTELDESSFEKITTKESRKALTVPPEEYFLFGDNRPNSEDSTYIGTVKKIDIEGKVTSIIRKAEYDNGKRW